MKSSIRRILYAGLTIFSLVFAAFIFFNGKSKPAFPELKERKGALARDPEWGLTQSSYQKLIKDLNAKPTDKKNLLQLAKTYMQEARVSGQYSYYNKAALDVTERVLAKDPSDLEAMCLKAMTFLSQHRFSDAKALAEHALQLNPHYSFVYGLLCDANVELGNYPEAVAAADKMVGTRPDIRSYSRVSYLREIYGDVSGAKEAIEMAIAAGFPGAEDKSWAMMVLAHLYEDSNALDMAEAQYLNALAERPDYPFALAGLGKIARYRKDYPKAIEYYEKAKDIMADASFFEALIDLYALNGEPEKSAACAQITIEALLADQISASKDKNQGHYSDMELSQLYLKTNALDKAMEHAKAEYQRRPNNLDACETLARVWLKMGKPEEAAPLLVTALHTHSQKPERLLLAAQVKLALGQKAEAQALRSRAISLKPYMEE